MANTKSAASNRAHGRKENRANTLLNGKAKQSEKKCSADGQGARQAALDIPIPLKNGHTSVLHDTGVRLTITPVESTARQGHVGPVSLDMEELIHRHSETFVHLSRSLLVRAKLAHSGCEPISILCACEEIGCRALRLFLPCQLGLTPGHVISMELFLAGNDEPTSIEGRVAKINRTGNEDIVRYIVEVEFCHLSRLAEKEIASFVHSSQTKDNWQLLIQ